MKKFVRLSTEEHDEFIDKMKSFGNADPSPKIGIFWFDVRRDELFGVKSADYDSVKPDKGKYIYKKLHLSVWSEFKNKAVHKKDIRNITRFSGDYTRTPRGRVNYENGVSVVYVGDWAENLLEKLTPLLCDEFDLKPDNIKFVVDEHWNIGHGFSGDAFN